jgi:hypothetical protein
MPRLPIVPFDQIEKFDELFGPMVAQYLAHGAGSLAVQLCQEAQSRKIRVEFGETRAARRDKFGVTSKRFSGNSGLLPSNLQMGRVRECARVGKNGVRNSSPVLARSKA